MSTNQEVSDDAVAFFVLKHWRTQTFVLLTCRKVAMLHATMVGRPSCQLSVSKGLCFTLSLSVVSCYTRSAFPFPALLSKMQVSSSELPATTRPAMLQGKHTATHRVFRKCKLDHTPIMLSTNAQVKSTTKLLVVYRVDWQ